MGRKINTKLIAFYLPQFHQVKENDEWWGEGFTEWTNVRKNKPLFKGHYQPRIPLNYNYYDLNDQSVMVRQMKLARKYGIDGFCFYHYWFKGKKLLEKPVEDVLKNKKAELPFCLMWANEPWTRTWDGDQYAKEILMNQEYGDKVDWKAHFEYLLPFFQDDRYMRVDEQPVFLIYNEAAISDCNEMLTYWRELAKEKGIRDIYYIRMQTWRRNRSYSPCFQAVADFQPFAVFRKYSHEDFLGNIDRILQDFNLKLYGKLMIRDYSSIYKKLMIEEKRSGKHFLGLFVDWDNSPRRAERGLIVRGATPRKFRKYLKIQLEKSIKRNNEFLFINAWNEWGEGAYLEPDKKYRYGYLKAIKSVKIELEYREKLK